jgi:hypothetical protein
VKSIPPKAGSIVRQILFARIVTLEKHGKILHINKPVDPQPL